MRAIATTGRREQGTAIELAIEAARDLGIEYVERRRRSIEELSL